MFWSVEARTFATEQLLRSQYIDCQVLMYFLVRNLCNLCFELAPFVALGLWLSMFHVSHVVTRQAVQRL